MEQSKKKYILINVYLSLTIFIATLFALFYGTQYIYGSLFGIIGLALYLFILEKSTKITSKEKYQFKWKKILFSMFFRITIFAAFILSPMAINYYCFGQVGINLIFHKINIIVIIIYYSVPWISALIFQWIK